jgi:hypothetical protein
MNPITVVVNEAAVTIRAPWARRPVIRASGVSLVLTLGLTSCGPTDSSSPAGSGGAAFTGGVSPGGGMPSGGQSSGGASFGGAPFGEGPTGGIVVTYGGSAVGGTAGPGGSANGGGVGGSLPNWAATPADGEFRACLDPSGHEMNLRIKTEAGCTELTLGDGDPASCLSFAPAGEWCVTKARFYSALPELCDKPGLTASHNADDLSTIAQGDVIVSEGGRLDLAVALDWVNVGGYAPPNISVSACFGNCEERDCRE